MSSHNAPDDKSKPVLKDKNPHNYRKVGFSMIVISVSLVAIGLLVWAVGSDYHFASNIMAAQEVDAMTPKAGYQIVLYDYTQPIGAKLKLLDQAGTLDAAESLQKQETQQNTIPTGQVLIFGTSQENNTNLIANAEVASRTPSHGYNVILFNTAYPVGAKLTLAKHDDSLVNATQYEQQQTSQITDSDVKVVMFTPSFTDNLKTITGSSVPADAFAAFANQTSVATTPTQVTGNQSAITNNTSTTIIPPTITSNQTGSNVEKTGINSTVSIIISHPSTNQTNTSALQNTTNTSFTKSVILNESVGVTVTPGK